MSRTLQSLSALSLLAVVGCLQEDPSQSNVDLDLEVRPDRVSLNTGEEAEVTLTSTVVGTSYPSVTLRLTATSSNPSVATAGDVGVSEEFGRRNENGTFTEDGSSWCLNAADLEMTLAVAVRCHEAGMARIDVAGAVSATDSFGSGTFKTFDTDTDVATVDVTCVAPGMGGDPNLSYLMGLGDEIFDDGGGALLAGTNTALDNGSTPHSTDEVAPEPGRGDHTEWYAHVAATLELTAMDASKAIFQCGEHALGRTVCAGNTDPPAPGSYLLIGGVLYEAPPVQPSTNLIYGFVLDSDGEAANNYPASSAYPNDFFQNTDWWTQLQGTSSGWVAVSSAINNGAPTPINDTQARVLMADNVMMLMLAASEIPVVTPLHRITAFEHEGDWGINGGDWSGDLHPQVSAGLASFEP